MPRSKVENISKGRSYKKNKPDPESSDSDTQYETISDNDDYDDDDDDSSYYPSSSNDSSEYCLKKHKKGKRMNEEDMSDFKNIISKMLGGSNKKQESPKSKLKSKHKSKSKSKSKSKYDDDDDDDDDDDVNDIDEDDDIVASEEDDDDNDEDNDEDSDDNDDDQEEQDNSKKDKNFKITLMIGGPQANSGMKTRIPSNLSNDEEYNTDDEQIYMRENFEAMELPGMPLSPTNSTESKTVNTQAMTVEPKKKKESKPDPLSEVVNIEEKYREIIELKRVLIDKLKSKPGNKIVQKALKQCNHSIKKLIKHARSKNANTYEELLDAADNQVITDEIGYFKTKLSNKEQLRIMSDLREINKHMYVEKPYRLSLLQSNMPPKFKAVALQRLHQLSMMEPGDPEYFKLKNWVDNFMRIPFGIYRNFSISINDGIDKCSEFVVKAKEQLDKCVYGLEDAKMQIMQMVGQWIANPASIGTAIAIHGPPGSGKCFGINTPILMFDGSVKMVQNVVVGDVIMGDDSSPRRILGLGRGVDTLYRVVYKNGENYVVNSEHILCLYNTQTSEYVEMEIRHFITMSAEEKAKYVGYRTSVNFTENYYASKSGIDKRISGTWTERMELFKELAGPMNMAMLKSSRGIMRAEYHVQVYQDASILTFVSRSLGYRTYLNKLSSNMLEVVIYNRDETDNKQIHVMEQIRIEVHREYGGDYYGFEIDGNKRFLLGDYTVTHNTSLVKDGISKILGREFAFIALGGCGDSSFLEGHSYTYEGSTWGKIAQIVMESKCMNPVIYFDELDKVSDTARGQEIIGVLTHLTDTTQNTQFHDKYFSEIELDLSKCMFIFSYNDENLVNPILRDRMYRIRTKGYDLKEKTIIARNYMLPKIREQVGFGPDDIIFSDEVLGHIISNQAKGEEGVRNLKRSLEIIHTKLNLYRLVKSSTQMFAKEMGLNVSFPYTLTKKDVDTLVKLDNPGSSALSMMYI
jgi:ATP-dependent Lon protease